MSLAETGQVFGQNETLISSIRNIIKDYPRKSIFKEFLQNADDAGATRFHVIFDHRSHPTNSLICNEMRHWQGPAILIFNNGTFSDDDFKSLMKIRVGGKQEDNAMIGKHGLGFNSCYHFTDVPSIVSRESIVFLDPQEKFLKRGDHFQRGIISPFPRNRRSSERDQLAPFEGIEGINFQSSFNGTLFRIPLRRAKSEISNQVFDMNEVRELFADIKSNISSEFLFLRNIEKIEMSYIPSNIRTGNSLQIRSLWTAAIIGLDSEVRDKRKRRLINDEVINDEVQIFQVRIRLNENNRAQNSHWIVATGAQENPTDQEEYAEQHRLSVLGGVAALLETSNNSNNFVGRMHSFLSLPETTYLPVHLSGTWAQGSDRARLLIDNGDLPDLDYQKLSWNRYILLDFLPKLYYELLNKIIELYTNGEINLEIHPVSKFWPFPPVTQNCPKYAIEYGCKVIQNILQNENFFQLIDDQDDANERIDTLFNLLPRAQMIGLNTLLQNNWDGIGVASNPDLKALVRSLPIWPTLSDPLNPDLEPPLKPALGGYILPKKINYRTRPGRIFLDANSDLVRLILTQLEVPLRDIYSYTFEDVQFPAPTAECDYYYLNFLKHILCHTSIIQGLRNMRCFPTFARKLKRISELYDQNNEVLRIVFGGSDVFLHPDFSGYSGSLSIIGFNNSIDERVFKKCAENIEELQNRSNPPPDVRYRGFILVDYFYKNSEDFDLDVIERIPFVPIARSLDLPYSLHYNHDQVLDCFKNIIIPRYKEVAWSQKCLIAEDVIPPSQILEDYPSLGKPNASIVVKHLRFLYGTLRNNEEWRRNWSGIFKHNIEEVYRWFEGECLDGDLILSDYINDDERLFLNYNRNQDPFDSGNWVSASDLILNVTQEEERYVNPSLAIYHHMLRSVGVREIIRPNVEIRVRRHRQSDFSQSKMFDFFLDQNFPLHDVIFVVNNDRIKTSRCALAASCEFFRQEFVSGRYSGSNPPITINIRNIEQIRDIRTNSMRILLRYLYGQSIDHAIQNRQSLNGDDEEHPSAVNDNNNLALYKDLLKLANYYNLHHLKELMELRLSYLVSRMNMQEIKRFAENSGANQLKEFCELFIEHNGRL